MKKHVILMAVVLGIGAGQVAAQERYTDTARVLKVKPLYETVQINQPEERCWNERVRHRGYSGSDSYTPTIAGAIIGGVVGNRFGKGDGKDVATVAGAILGGSIGNDLGKRSYSRSYVTTERRCETVDHYREKQELVGYRVKYRYNGKTFWTRTSSHPGDYLTLEVSLVPSEQSSGYRFDDY